MNKTGQTCKLCGTTVHECRSWHYCPKEKEVVCHCCHEKCEHLKIYNGYMQRCMYTEAKKQA